MESNARQLTDLLPLLPYYESKRARDFLELNLPRGTFLKKNKINKIQQIRFHQSYLEYIRETHILTAKFDWYDRCYEQHGEHSKCYAI